jgi:site-specific DNA-methyltransferase (adenine-specific)
VLQKEISAMNIEDFTNRIIVGDCIKNLKKIPNESVDLIFADPPYWMQTEGELIRTNGKAFSGVNDSWDKFDSFRQYDEFSISWLTECKRVLKPTGTIWVIGSFQNIYRIGCIMQNLGFWILNDVVWAKPNAVPNFGGTRFQNSHETLLWCSKSQKSKFTFNYKTMKFLNGGKQAKSIWDIGICIGNERLKGEDGKKIHSTQKPERLLYNVIISSTKPNDIVLDPFFGTGTTGAVAKSINRKYIGLEREQKYVDAAQKRINAVKMQSDEISDLSLEIKPPKVSIEKLIEEKFLSIGEKLYNKKDECIGILLKDGKVKDEAGDCLSIHKISAKYQGLKNANGWDYLYFKDKKQELKSINDLRYEYDKGGENGTN